MRYSVFAPFWILLGIAIALNDNSTRFPNILLILADDLGYGDLSVSPFTGHGIKSPELGGLD